MTRQCSLNSGAANVRSITKVYSEHLAADGRSLHLESGSLKAVLRWEKRTDVLCMLQEGRALRNAILQQGSPISRRPIPEANHTRSP